MDVDYLYSLTSLRKFDWLPFVMLPSIFPENGSREDGEEDIICSKVASATSVSEF